MDQIVLERGRVWKIEDLEPRTVALDGAVQGPYIGSDDEIYSLDHHGDCIRGVTLATCEQVRDFIKLGKDFSGYTILLNDIDLDASLSAWLLLNPGRASEPIVEKLVHAVGRQDAHCGQYPASTSVPNYIIDWIAEPETSLKQSGYEDMPNGQLKFILEAIFGRIEKYADGQAPQAAKDPSPVQEDKEGYEVIRRGTDWKLIRLEGDRGLRGIAEDNITRWVAYREVDIDGQASLVVTIGKKCEATSGFPIGPPEQENTILYALNKVEPKRKARDGNWGGTTTVGGSPKNSDGSGTTLSMDDIFDTVEGVVRANQGSDEENKNGQGKKDGQKKEPPARRTTAKKKSSKKEK
jgi:hypothetical protein